jgi:hypothetical protein
MCPGTHRFVFRIFPADRAKEKLADIRRRISGVCGEKKKQWQNTLTAKNAKMNRKEKKVLTMRKIRRHEDML